VTFPTLTIHLRPVSTSSKDASLFIFHRAHHLGPTILSSVRLFAYICAIITAWHYLVQSLVIQGPSVRHSRSNHIVGKRFIRVVTVHPTVPCS
jgi:hypothetical protein